MKKLILIWLSLLFIVLSACGAPDDADVIEKKLNELINEEYSFHLEWGPQFDGRVLSSAECDDKGRQAMQNFISELKPNQYKDNSDIGLPKDGYTYIIGISIDGDLSVRITGGGGSVCVVSILDKNGEAEMSAYFDLEKESYDDLEAVCGIEPDEWHIN